MDKEKREKGIERAIQDALEQGKFDNLPGKGKPIEWKDNPYEKPDMVLANKILKDANFTLPWIATMKQIDTDLEQARAALSRSWEWVVNARQEGRFSLAESEWTLAKNRFVDEIARLNKLIFNHNLQIPSSQFERFKVDTQQEIRRLEEG